MKVDLHSHSHLSDGQHPVSFLVERARATGVTHLAVTDHDFMHVDLTRDAVSDVTLINGVEISCHWENLELHIVGLLVDPQSEQLQQLLTAQQEKRSRRIAAMDQLLEKQGITGLRQNTEALEAVSLSRSHVADFLVNTGVCRNRQKAFKQYLGKQGKVSVASEWCELVNAIDAIHAAGGVAVLAHPGRYPLNRRRLALLTGTFKEARGDALECSYPNVTPEMKTALVTLAVEHELWLSAGSDFHDASAKWTDIGKFPQLREAEEERAVWHHPAWLARYPRIAPATSGAD